ncbi:MAG: hypothetical protein GY778_08570 [bacterium]|nr:hypothetical protein [bacterium]
MFERFDRNSVGCLGLALACAIALVGCTAVGGGTGGGDGGDQNGEEAENGPGPGGAGDNGLPGGEAGEAGELTVDFPSAGGGNFAVARDEAGNEYSIRTRERGGRRTIAEVNVLMPDGVEVKCSLDDEGRPIKFRTSEHEHADILYDGDDARVRYTSADGTTADVSALNAASARARVQRRRADRGDKRGPAMQAATEVTDLREGLETYEEIIESIFADEANPARGTLIESTARAIAAIASGFDIRSADGALEDVELDEIPPTIRSLAGQTYVLFEAEGFCVEEAGLENELTFDQYGILITERDRNFIFPDFSLGGTSPGFIINYQAGTVVDLTGGEDLEFSAQVTPVFTGTQLDGEGYITIERRFLAEVEFDVDFFTVSTARAEQLFNAAFINGTLSDDGNVLELDLILVDLMEEAPVERLGRVRYYRQGSPVPADRMYLCEVQDGDEDGPAELECPGRAEPYEPVEVRLTDARRPEAGRLDYDWFISDGFGFLDGPMSTPLNVVIPTAPGWLTVNVIVSDLTVEPAVFELYTCDILVGDVAGDAGAIDCLEFMTPGLPGTFFLSELAPPPEEVEGFEWSVAGTDQFEILDPFGAGTEINFLTDGLFEVRLDIFKPDGTVERSVCEVTVGLGAGGDDDPADDPGENDECDTMGDGYCDHDCPHDPDCMDTHLCDPNDFASDGYCDPDCDLYDPDCDTGHLCDPHDYVGDGYCDDECDLPDPDCDDESLCDPNDFPGDDFCDPECDLADPDCDEVALCDPNDFRDDGFCDLECDLADPDCDNVIVTDTAILCLEIMTAEQPGTFFLSDQLPPPDQIAAFQWRVIGTEEFEIQDPNGGGTQINFFEDGDFQVRLEITRTDGTIEVSTCEVLVQPPA